jgi:hypothetical protein
VEAWRNIRYPREIASWRPLYISIALRQPREEHYEQDS